MCGTTANACATALYGPNTAQVELLLGGIAHAKQGDLWSLGLHFTTCMQERIGIVTLRNAVKASRFAAQIHGRFPQWEQARQTAADAATARATAVGITDPRQIAEACGLLVAAAGVIVVADSLAVAFQQEALDAVEHFLGVTFDLPAPVTPQGRPERA